jgi:hypothetical protein
MNAIEEDLAAMTSSMEEILSIMEQGAAAATAAIDQLNGAVTQAQTKATELQAKIQGTQDKVKTGLGQRENNILSLPANSYPQRRPQRIGQGPQRCGRLRTFPAA